MANDPYRYFRLEARELVEQLGKGMLELERGGGADVVAKLLRWAHTLKGAARVVRQGEIADRAHAIEDALAPLRDGRDRVSADLVGRVLAIVDEIARSVAALDLPADASRPAQPMQPVQEPVSAVRAELADMDALLEGINETSARVGALRSPTNDLRDAAHFLDALTAMLAGRGGRESEKQRELAEEARAAIRRCERELRGGIDGASRELAQVRDAAEQLRLVPAGSLLASLERTARDTSHALGKQVVLEARGSDVRLDAHVLAAIQSALVQLVRNAVAHGIETPRERNAAGKPASGRIIVEVERRGGRARFRCHDDGRGLDLEAVRRAAIVRGVSDADASNLKASDIVALLLRGGISTTTRVTELAGRGVGLDVVRAACEQLGGEVRVETGDGAGTMFELIVPISLASVEALVVVAGDAWAAIPLDAVRAARRIHSSDVARTAHGETLVFDGTTIPLLRLAPILRDDSSPTRDREVRAAIVIEAGSRLAAIAVDHLAGTATVVVRPIPELAAADAVVAGASLEADGTPRLVLDPGELVAAAQRGRALQPAAERTRHAVLVIDDSLTTRMLEQSILESAGYEVDTAVSGEAGLEAARRRRYALFLVDVEMPGIDGFTFIERVRADPALRDTPAILVTSRADAEDRARGERVGAQGYIVKSEFDQNDLLARIERMVN